jgi:hypothetical protein
MAEIELLQYYKKMCERNIVLDFQGAISQEMVVGMAELLKRKFSQKFGHSNLVKRIFSIFVEMAQNIASYSAERVFLHGVDIDVGAGIIMVTEENKIYAVTSGNLVEKVAIPIITEYCDKINRLDREQLKQFYKSQIKSSRQRLRKKASLGLIDIARKAGYPIIYRATPVDDGHCFLVLSVKIQEEIDNG